MEEHSLETPIIPRPWKDDTTYWDMGFAISVFLRDMPYATSIHQDWLR